MANIAQRGRVLFEEALLAHHLLQFLALALVVVAEDGASELLDLSDDVPRTVVVDVLDDVVHEPLQFGVGGGETLYQHVDGHFLHLHIIKPDTQGGREVKFAGKVAQHALEEGVDGLYSEIAVVVEQIVQSYACLPAGIVGGYVKLTAHEVGIGLRLGQVPPDAEELAQDAGLHLLGGLISKGDGQYLPVGLWIIYQQGDVLSRQREGLAASRAGLIYN